MSNGNLFLLCVLSLSCLAFAVFVWWDGASFRYRKDMREEKKAADVRRDPFILDKDQQPAELQVGEKEEVRRLNRFVPDQPQH